ncbi:MAG TPA: flagellar FlbD family protein [Gaiellaceae bacterium]|nr:flagellar FlbD family protein [Gaiellaceae bacterium]
MIPLHRLSNPERTIHVNPELIHAVESAPDTVLTMTNGSRLVVAESACDVIELIRSWRAGIYARALGLPEPTSAPLAEVLPLAAGLD